MKHTLIQNVAHAAEPDSFSGCSHGPAPAARRAVNAPPIFVNGVAIAETAIGQEAQNHSAATGAEARAAAARALVIRELLLQRAHTLQLTPAQTCDGEGREETADEALIRQVLELEAPPAEPREAECRRVYEAGALRFTSPELYEASHILFAPADDGADSWARAHAQAHEAIMAMVAGADFGEWARTRSACPTAGQGGSLGQLKRGDLAAEIESALMSLEPGKVGQEPVRTRHGWHVIRLERIVAAKRLPFELVESRIKNALRARAWAAASARYVAALAAAAEIEGLALSFGAQT